MKLFHRRSRRGRNRPKLGRSCVDADESRSGGGGQGNSEPNPASSSSWRRWKKKRSSAAAAGNDRKTSRPAAAAAAAVEPRSGRVCRRSETSTATATTSNSSIFRSIHQQPPNAPTASSSSSPQGLLHPTATGSTLACGSSSSDHHPFDELEAESMAPASSSSALLAQEARRFAGSELNTKPQQTTPENDVVTTMLSSERAPVLQHPSPLLLKNKNDNERPPHPTALSSENENRINNNVPCRPAPRCCEVVVVERQLERGVELLDRARELLAAETARGEAWRLFREAAVLLEPCAAAAWTTGSSSVDGVAALGPLHAARCRLYLGSLVADARASVSHLHRVVQLCDVARERVEVAAVRGGHRRTDDDDDDDDRTKNKNAAPTAAAAAATTISRVCLDTMIVKALQVQAGVLLDKLNDPGQALLCFEEILRRLLHWDEVHSSSPSPSSSSWENYDAPSDRRLVLVRDIQFVALSQLQHTKLLHETLSSLMVRRSGALFVPQPQPTDDGEISSSLLELCEEALTLLRARLPENHHFGGGGDVAYDKEELKVDAVASLHRQLAEVYRSRQEHDRALLSLRDYADVTRSASSSSGEEEPCGFEAVLATIHAFGKTYEQMGNNHCALHCYELAVNYGTSDVSVARTLVNVARTRELLEGESPESLQLWQAAKSILSLHVVDNDDAVGD